VNDALLLTAIAAGTALATGLGALPVLALGAHRARAAQGMLNGIAAGVMAVAATVGLLAPALQHGRTVSVLLAAAAGPSRSCSRGKPCDTTRSPAGAARRARARCSCSASCSSTVCRRGLQSVARSPPRRPAFGVFVITAIAIQNVPEGTATAAAMQPAGYSPWRQVWGAVLTSVPQVPGAVVAWLAVEQIEGLLPVSFARAGGAMLALVVIDLLPDAWQHEAHGRVIAGTVLGAAVMLLVGLTLDV
jgi:zinc transporter, ZIP family